MTTYAPQDGGSPDTNTPDLGYHYPIIPDDSTGTDFWVAFCSLYDDGNNALSLCISKSGGSQRDSFHLLDPVVNGPILVVTNCGDTSVNGNYALTNMTGQVLTDWLPIILWGRPQRHDKWLHERRGLGDL